MKHSRKPIRQQRKFIKKHDLDSREMQLPGQISLFDFLHIDEASKHKRMNVLCACEESQAVAIEFRKLGHNAFSCDIMECSGGHPEWHIQQDVLTILNPEPLMLNPEKQGIGFFTVDGEWHFIEGRWDLIIAFPPCTHLAVSGTRHFEKKRADGRQKEGIEFFCSFLNADCEMVAIENPVGIISGDYIPNHFPDIAEKYALPRKPTQIIQPWMFGDNARKSTCLWLFGLDPLVPEVTVEPELEFYEWTDRKTGKKKRQPMWYFKARTGNHGKKRSKTFPGIARAMAQQWGGIDSTMKNGGNTYE